MKKRSRKMDAGTVSASHGQFDVVTRGRHPTMNTWAQGRPPPCRASPAFFGRQGRFQLLVFLFSCLPAQGMGTAEESPGVGQFLTRAPRGGTGLNKGPTPSLPAWSYLVPGKSCLVSECSKFRTIPPRLHPLADPNALAQGRPQGGQQPPQRRPHGASSRRTSGPAPVITMSCACRSFSGLKHANSARAAGLPWSLLAQTGRME